MVGLAADAGNSNARTAALGGGNATVKPARRAGGGGDSGGGGGGSGPECEEPALGGPHGSSGTAGGNKDAHGRSAAVTGAAGLSRGGAVDAALPDPSANVAGGPSGAAEAVVGAGPAGSGGGFGRGGPCALGGLGTATTCGTMLSDRAVGVGAVDGAATVLLEGAAGGGSRSMLNVGTGRGDRSRRRVSSSAVLTREPISSRSRSRSRGWRRWSDSRFPTSSVTAQLTSPWLPRRPGECMRPDGRLPARSYPPPRTP